MVNRVEIELLLERALNSGADFAELFFEDCDELTLGYEDSLHGLSTIRIFGVGIYLIAGFRSVYVSTSETTFSALEKAVDTAAALLSEEGRTAGSPRKAGTVKPPEPCPVTIYPGTVEHADKIDVLRQAGSAAKSFSGALRRISIDYFDRDQRVRIVNSEGVDVEDRRITTRLRFIPHIANDCGSISYFSDYSAAAGFEAVKDGQYLPGLKYVLRNMEESLTAAEAPGGRFPVIFEGGSCTGTFFHEACGHQLETTELRKGGLFRDKLARMIASDKVTLIDDGTLAGMYGSSRFDDEGAPRKRNILIEKGILTGYLADRIGARILGLERSGSGRRQNYGFAPGARMSNTFLALGDDNDDAIISDTEEGLYVTDIGGGTGGREFTLLARSAYWIRKGKIDRRVKGAMLIGRGDEAMLKIDRVGKEICYEQGGGSFCGAESGFCAVTASGPRMRISDMLVGGKGSRP